MKEPAPGGVDNISLRSVYDKTDRTRDSDILTEVAAEVAPLTVEAEGARETHRQTHPSRVPPAGGAVRDTRPLV